MFQMRPSMKTAHGKTFMSWPEAMAVGQPWDPAHFCDYGYPIGRDLRNGSLVLFDPHVIRKEGTTWSTAWEITGQTRYGKSELEKQLLIKFLCRGAGYDSQGRQIKSRSQYHTDKSTPGENEDIAAKSEVEEIVEYYQGNMLYLGEKKGIDLFDTYYTGNRIVEILSVAHTICTMSKGAPLDGDETFSLQIGIFALTRHAESAINEFGMEVFTPKGMETIKTDILEGVMRTPSVDDAFEYFGIDNNRLRHAYERELVSRPDLQKRLNLELTKQRLDESAYMSAGSRIMTYLNAFHGAQFGMMFGGEVSMSELVSGRLVGVEWKGVPALARSILQTLEWNAMRIHSSRGGFQSLLAHNRIQDEGAGAAINAEHVYARAEYVRTTSQFRRFDLTAAQYWSQLALVGEPGSMLRTKAGEIQKAIGGRIIGKLEEKDEYINELSRTVSQEDIDYMVNDFTPGCFALIVPNLAPVMMYAYCTPQDELFMHTNQAVDSMTAAPPLSLQKMAQRAEQFGVTFVTGDDIRRLQPK